MTEISTKLLAILDEWECGKRNEQSVHEEAEVLFAVTGWKLCPRDTKESAIFEVLSQLDVLNHQLIIRDDIPTIKRFLSESCLDPLTAWRNWECYWNSIDYEARKAQLRSHGYYSV